VLQSAVRWVVLSVGEMVEIMAMRLADGWVVGKDDEIGRK
jgi:hypothetical protein